MRGKAETAFRFRLAAMCVLCGLCALCAFLFSSCTEKIDLDNAAYGVLYTTEYENRSLLEWFDDNNEVIGSTRYRFSGASLAGFKNMCRVGDRVFFIPNGNLDRRDYGRAVCIDLSSGETRYYRFDRINVTGWAATEETLSVVSNLNGECYIDVIDLEQETIKSMRCPERIMVYNIVRCDGELYGIASKDDWEVFLCRCDVENSGIVPVMELEGYQTPGFQQEFEGRIMFLHEGRLLTYDPRTGKSEVRELPHRDAFNLNIIDGIIWIGYTDIHDSDKRSRVEGIRASDGETIGGATVDDAILQIEGDGQQLMLRSYDKLYRYDFTGDDLILRETLPCGKEGFYPGECILCTGDGR